MADELLLVVAKGHTKYLKMFREAEEIQKRRICFKNVFFSKMVDEIVLFLLKNPKETSAY